MQPPAYATPQPGYLPSEKPSAMDLLPILHNRDYSTTICQPHAAGQPTNCATSKKRRSKFLRQSKIQQMTVQCSVVLLFGLSRVNQRHRGCPPVGPHPPITSGRSKSQQMEILKRPQVGIFSTPTDRLLTTLYFFLQRQRYVVAGSMFFVRELKHGFATNSCIFGSGGTILRAQHCLDANSCF